MLKKTLIVFITGFVLLGMAWGLRYLRYMKESAPKAVAIENLGITDSAQDAALIGNVTIENPIQAMSTLPESLNFDMTFYPQAPFANWDYPWQEACEEASVLLVANEYLKKEWRREEFNDQILNLVAWEKQRFGYYEHTNVGEILQILKEYFGLASIIHENPKYEDVKRILNKGHLIIVTLAGKKLNNPYYRNGGPIYHALVIKGYKQGRKVVTHDVGTKRGENYVYPWEVIEKAIHDYAEPIEEGKKLLIEVVPEIK